MKDVLLNKLRQQLVKHQLTAYYVPTADPHASEYLSEAFKRVGAVSGFTGSAGTVIVTKDQALLWTDSRYWQQSVDELSAAWTLMKPCAKTIAAWLDELPDASRVGFDPQVMSVAGHKMITKALTRNKGAAVAVPGNLVDAVWDARPAVPRSEVFHLADAYTGRTAAEKLADVRANLKEKKAHGVVFSALDDVAWLLNLRGSDVHATPVFLAYAVLTSTDAFLFTDLSRVNAGAKEAVNGLVTLRPYDGVVAAISELFATHVDGAAQRVLYDEGPTSIVVLDALKAVCEPVVSSSSVQEKKAVKNDTEAQGFVDCHIRDGAALAQYLKWLEAQVAAGTAVNEFEGAERLRRFRATKDKFVGISFDSISSSGPNGAVIHYRPLEDKCRAIVKDELYLIDSGGQYYDGTTDVTRTICFQTPRPIEKEMYTLVLKGNIALNSVVFPSGTHGQRLDVLARAALWQQGQDYGHGTGHGVGHFLGVHEGPISIGTRASAAAIPLAANNVVSNEPGFYENGAFGIRIENLELVVPAETRFKFQDKQFLKFKTLTMCPLDAALIDTALLTEEEIASIDGYHATVLATLTDYVSKHQGADPELAGLVPWLEKKCAPLATASAVPPAKRARK